jgi:PBSX family phage terminase large subunit
MTNEIEISYKFEPLFDLLDDDCLPEVDTVVLTGGRASSKSFNVALLSNIGLISKAWKVLYSRFTNTSIGDSIKSEVSDKLELLGYENLVIDNQHSIESKVNNGKISFKGIKTGSKGQTANLKSLSGFNCFVVDEAEEIPSYETFKKVYYSIRSVDKRNISILILNPTTKQHWIYKEFFKKKNVPDGFCGVIDNVLYIHSSYLDVNPKFIPVNIKRDYERLKDEDPEEYKNIVLGGWKSEVDGVLFSKSELKTFSIDQIDRSKAIGKIAFIDVADTGEDFHAVPIGEIIDDRIYIIDVLFTPLGTDINVDLTAEILNKYNPEFVRIESNFGGSMYNGLLSPKLNKTITALPIRATTNKHSRIIQMSGFIKRFVYFRNDIEIGSDYDKFMENIYEYTKDGKANHDDAPDSIEGLCSMARSFHSNIWQ